MPDYQAIYNHVVTTDPRYNQAENSPGLRAAIQATEQLKMISGRSLDIGCGVGFVVEYLAGPTFDLLAFGVDVSDVSIDRAKTRLASIAGCAQRLTVLKSPQLPFETDFFSLVTCFDVLEHLDPNDIENLKQEIPRVLRPGGIFFGSVSCRKSGVNDQFGDNLHRTIRSVDWWIEQFQPDQIEFDAIRQQLTIWKRSPLVKVDGRAKREMGKVNSVENKPSGQNAEYHFGNTAALYQKIYDENPWYGNALRDRCPGIRLLPQYSDWLLGPVMDLGCGRGQTVERLRELGFEAEGIDQIKNHVGMRVGDITQPIDDLGNFNSIVCVDCIEHLFPKQVEGLFSNMQQVQRQAFSIHNGESTGTGQELHVNRLSFDEWEELIGKYFEIESIIPVTPEQKLYLTKSRR